MKVEENIYFDERCKHHPYCLNIMRNGKRLSYKCDTLEEARQRKELFIRQHNRMPTDDPDVFKQDGKYIIEITIIRHYDEFEKAAEKAKILRKFMKLK